VSESNLNADLVVEQHAAIEHQRWADWQRWMHDQCRRNEDGSLTIPAELVERWERQIATPYEELTEEEKESDRLQVHRYLSLLVTPIRRVDQKYGPFDEFAWFRESLLIDGPESGGSIDA